MLGGHTTLCSDGLSHASSLGCQAHEHRGISISNPYRLQLGILWAAGVTTWMTCGLTSSFSSAGPEKSDITKNKAVDVEYYAKVMGISALIGYSVKLALLANIGVPDPGSVGVVVEPNVWKRQVAISVIGMVVLSLLVLSNASYMLNQSRAWVYQLPYMQVSNSQPKAALHQEVIHLMQCTHVMVILPASRDFDSG